MIIYFAGTTMIREREELLLEHSRLFSYHYHKEDGDASKDWEVRIENIYGRTIF